MIVCVTGGRDFRDWDRMNRVLNSIHLKHRIELIVHGGASGADHLAHTWAKTQVPPVELRRFAADWKNSGHKAGPRRNTEMANWLLEEYRKMPENVQVLAFPTGGRGTEDMIAKCKLRQLPVTIYYDNNVSVVF